MYLFEIQDILFAIKSIKTPSSHFDITNYIVFSSANTRSGASNKLILPHHQNNVSRHSYFHRLPLLWNALPILDMSMSFYILKSKLKRFMWEHFLANFDANNNCTLHYLCPCSIDVINRNPLHLTLTIYYNYHTICYVNSYVYICVCCTGCWYILPPVLWCVYTVKPLIIIIIIIMRKL